MIHMTDKKQTDKKIKTEAKPAKAKVVKPKVNAPVKREALEEEKFLACEIAKNLNVPGFTFLIMKQEAGISDNSFLTISEFQKIHDRTVGR